MSPGFFPGPIAAVEFSLLLVLCEPFLKEFRPRAESLQPWLPQALMLAAAFAAILLFRRVASRRPIAAWAACGVTLAAALAVNWAAAAYSTGNWPIDRKLAGYLAVWCLYFFHMLSLYAATWLPSLRLRGAPGLWLHAALVAALGAYLVGDFEYYRLSANHAGVGYLRFFFARDAFAHMGVQTGFWHAPALKMTLLAGAAAASPLAETWRRRA